MIILLVSMCAEFVSVLEIMDNMAALVSWGTHAVIGMQPEQNNGLIRATREMPSRSSNLVAYRLIHDGSCTPILGA